MAYEDDLDQSQAIQRALAQAKILRGMSAIPDATQGTKVTGGSSPGGSFSHYVAPHWSQQLSPMLNQVMAGHYEGKASDLEAAQSLAQRRNMEEMIGEIPRDIPASPGQMPMNSETGEALMGPPTGATAEKKATSADRAAWGVKAMRNPLMKSLGSKVVEDALTKDPNEELKQLLGYSKLSTAERIASGKNEATVKSAELGANAKMYTADQALSGKKYASDKGFLGMQERNATMLQIAKDKLTAGGTKPLSDGAQKRLGELSNEYKDQERLLSSYDDAYSGAGAMAKGIGAKYFLGEDFNLNTPEGQAAAEWWRDFNSVENVKRHTLFGSALTEGEMKAWKSASVNHWSSPEAIKAAIETRRKISEDHLNMALNNAEKPANVAIAEMRPGAKPGAPGAPTGNPLPGARPAAPAPVQVKSIDEALKLPPGTLFLDPKGEPRVR